MNSSSLYDLLRRKGVTYEDIARYDSERPSDAVIEQTQLETEHEIRRLYCQAEKQIG